jgi:protein phosphatase
MKINYFAKSDVGIIRKNNEDNYCIAENKFGHKIFIVADGMGGHNAGEVASEMACKIISGSFKSLENVPNYKEFLKTSISLANHNIYKQSLIHTEMAKMGTTVSVLIYDSKNVYTGHVGDSRIYYLSSSSIKQITKDHTLVQAMVDSGTLNQEKAKSVKYKNVLLQALGTSQTLTIEIKELKLPNKFRFIMCSDGLTGILTDERIEELYNNGSMIEESVHNLIDMANEIDGSDNVTVIAVERGVYNE